ncbi:hypothetical protein ACCO45_006155 [Purpureocillium lilacinum]|uniref:Uncharacterized protein n=1 Tax=Purpureocillium lilacinum TaxID=33203 RepID=A0ACC4DYD6_PURLI
MSQTLTEPPASHPAPGGDAFELSRVISSGSRAGRVVGSASAATGDTKSSPEAAVGERDASDDGAPPPDAYGVVERWNWPRSNVAKLAFSLVSFTLAGMNDAAVGLEEYYNLSYTVVSLIFPHPLRRLLHRRLHQCPHPRRPRPPRRRRHGPLCHIITYAILASHPPYPVLVVANAISGFGNGLTDACFCAWVGAMDKANAIQGFLHASYSLGALFAPLIATSMVVKAELPWYNFYYVMIGMGVVEFAGLTISFWRDTGAVYRAQHAQENDTGSGAGTRDAIKSKVTWLCALFFFAYMGVEVGLGGWIVTFMLRVRHATPYASGISGSGFWAGMAVGRAGLGFVTERYGERLCLTIYLAACLALELLFWLVPSFVVSAVAAAFLGFFLGPMFPGAVMVTAKLLPKRIHVSAIGFAMALGGTGGTVFPFIIGAIASKKGVAVLQPVVLALIVLVAGVWLSFPRIKKRD